MQLFTYIHAWLATSLRRGRNNDRGSASVEAVIITAIMITAAVLVATAIFTYVQNGVSRFNEGW